MRFHDTPAPAIGWDALAARLRAAEHAQIDRAGGVPWSCGCSDCAAARRHVAILALRRHQLAASLDVVRAEIEAAGDELAV